MIDSILSEHLNHNSLIHGHSERSFRNRKEYLHQYECVSSRNMESCVEDGHYSVGLALVHGKTKRAIRFGSCVLTLPGCGHEDID